MPLSKLYYVYGLDTSCFYTEEEEQIEKKIIKARHLKSVLKTWTNKKEIIRNIHKVQHHTKIEDKPIVKIKKPKREKKEYILNHKQRIKFLNDTIAENKEKLKKLLAENKNTTRNVIADKLTLKRRVSIFDSNLTRCLNLKEREINEELLIIKVYFFDVAESIVKNGFYMNGYKYVFFSSSSGQIRTKKLVAVREDLLNQCWNTLTAGLTIDYINKCGGMNINKFIAYLALCNSATDLWEGFDIDRCIVVDDFETMVNDTVDFIDDKTYIIERKNMDISIPHTDGVGMILPSLSNKNFMVRLPFVKGLLGSFDFVRFIEENNCNKKIKDIYGDVYDIIADNIQIIFTKSQFKMWKFYSNWQDYKDKFNKYNCTAGKCKEEEEDFKESTINYQMIQTLNDMTDDELKELCKESIYDIENLSHDLKTMLKVLGVDEDNNGNYFQKCLSIYPELIGDLYSRETLRNKKVSLENDLYSAKLKVGGKYTFVIPDLYAFCEWLFLGIENPKGLLENKKVCCKLFDDGIKIDCLRSPSLYKEHAVRTNDIKNDWFNTNAIYTSCFDTISKILQFDCDGDTLLLVDNKTQVTCAERNMKDIVPLFYNMAKATSVLIDNDVIFNGLMLAYTGGNVGVPSNDISKIWNSGEITQEKLDIIKWLCLQTNFVIDYAKTLYKPTPPQEVIDKINKYIKNKVPNFFIYAKNKEEKNVEEINDSTVNRIQKIYKKKKFNFNFTHDNIGKFNYQMLLHNQNAVCIQEICDKYKEVSSTLNFNKSGEDSLNNYFAVFDDAKKQIRDLGYSDTKIVDVLIIDLFKNRKTENKKAFWTMYGKIVYNNIKNNLEDNSAICDKCGKRYFKNVDNQKYCFKCQGYQKKGTKTITCIDCSKEFEVGGNSKRNRCEKCYNKYRKYIINQNAQKYYKTKIG